MKATRLQLLLGFLCIYVVWGSTYLGIRIGIATIPPFLMGGTRFLLAGGALYAWSRLRGGARPDFEQWKNAAIIGALLLMVGNGAVSWAEQRVDSGMTSLLVATVPLWIVLAEFVQGKRPALLQWVGVGLGLIGVGLLVKPSSNASVASVDPYGAAVLMMGSLSWTIGSLFSRTARLARPASMASGMQMISGGVLMMFVSVITGELATFKPTAVSTASVLAWLYLIVFGSIIAFSAYMWLLSVVSPAAAGTYAYVNPMVAVVLGVAIGGETLPPSAPLSMVIITGSVALVSLAPYLKRGWRRAVENG